jgi:predicted permease
MARLRQDVRYAARHLLRSPGFAISAIVTLAVGIGANLTVFLILYGVILRPLPFPHNEQLVRIARRYAGSNEDSPAYSGTKILFMNRTNRSFESMAGYDYFPRTISLMEQQAAVPLQALGVTSSFFHVFEMEPVLGHGFTPADMQRGAAGVAVLSDATWRNQFGADPGILGRAITLGSSKYTVVGVADSKFRLDAKVDVWLPLQIAENPENHDNDFNVVARLKPSVTPSLAQEDLKHTLLLLKETYPKLWSEQESVHVWDYHDSLIGQVKPALRILMGAVGLLLVIVSANILSLLLTRSIARRREMSLRAALGATGARLLQQMLVENLLLCVLGGALGAVLAQLATPVLLHLSPIAIPQFAVLNIGGAGFVFAAALAIGCALLFSFVPLMEARRAELNDSLRMNPTQVAGGKIPAQRALVVCEVAMSLVLMVAAALLLTSFWRLIHASAGFDATNVVTFKTGFTDAQTVNSVIFGQTLDKVAARVEALPGVESAAAVINPPTQIVPDLPFEVVGRASEQDHDYDEKYIPITADYFSALKIPVIAGRAYNTSDTMAAAPVLIVNEQFAKTYFPGENPIGQHILIGKAMGPEFEDRVREIVGVVGDVKQLGLDVPAPAAMYLPVGQLPDSLARLEGRTYGMSWVVRMKSSQVDFAGPLRQALLDTAQLPLLGITSMEQIVSASVSRQRFSMLLLCGFGVIALLLGGFGLYGVMSYTVARQTKEIGVRMALGAQRGDILGMVLREAGWLVGFGLVIGVAASIAGGRLISSLLFGVAAGDLRTLLAMSFLLVATGLFAAWLPARRAASTEPMKALRME